MSALKALSAKKILYFFSGTLVLLFAAIFLVLAAPQPQTVGANDDHCSVVDRDTYRMGQRAAQFSYVYVNTSGTILCPDQADSSTEVAIAFKPRGSSVTSIFHKTDYSSNNNVYRFTNPEGHNGESNYILVRHGAAGSGTEYYTDNDGDETSDNISIRDHADISRQALNRSAESGTGTAPGQTDDDFEDEPEKTCEDTGGFFGWMLCPAVSMVAGSFEWLGGQIEALLDIDKDRYTDDRLQEAWAVIRNLAYILLVPAMLVMVIATALGYDFVSAYTVKKALPRMVAAVIFIAFSWEITVLLIDFIHTIGRGIRGIVLAPFDVRGFGDVFNPGVTSTGFQWGALVGGAFLVGFSATILSILVSFIGTAVLILLTIFLFLVAREIFILALMVIAPLAILAWIFPGRTRLWSMWWGLFSKLLFIYPIIMLMTAIGLIFASLIESPQQAGLAARGTHAVLEPLLKTAAFVIPYALIPVAFKYVGGVVGNLAGMVNDKERGMFDRLKNRRQSLYKSAKREAKAGTLANRLEGRGPSRAVNTAVSTAAAGPRAWKRGRAGVQAARESAIFTGSAEAVEGNEVFAANQNNDKFLLAAANKQLAQDKLKEATDKGDEVQVAHWKNAIANSERLPQNKLTQAAALQKLAATGYQLSPGQQGYNELAETAASVTGAELERDANGNVLRANAGNIGAYSSMMNNAQFNLKNAGRLDLAGINDGAGYDREAGLKKAGLYQLANSKKQSVAAMATLPEGPLEGDLGHKAAVTYRELESMQPNATGDVKAEIDKQLQNLRNRGVIEYMEKPTGQTRQVRKPHPNDPNHYVYEDVPITLGDVASRQARTYQQPDPNRMEDS